MPWNTGGRKDWRSRQRVGRRARRGEQRAIVQQLTQPPVAAGQVDAAAARATLPLAAQPVKQFGARPQQQLGGSRERPGTGAGRLPAPCSRASRLTPPRARSSSRRALSAAVPVLQLTGAGFLQRDRGPQYHRRVGQRGLGGHHVPDRRRQAGGGDADRRGHRGAA